MKQSIGHWFKGSLAMWISASIVNCDKPNPHFCLKCHSFLAQIVFHPVSNGLESIIFIWKLATINRNHELLTIFQLSSTGNSNLNSLETMSRSHLMTISKPTHFLSLCLLLSFNFLHINGSILRDSFYKSSETRFSSHLWSSEITSDGEQFFRTALRISFWGKSTRWDR